MDVRRSRGQSDQQEVQTPNEDFRLCSKFRSQPGFDDCGIEELVDTMNRCFR